MRATRATPMILLGAGPRAGVHLMVAARWRALLDGRAFVTPDDVRRMLHPVICHRLVLAPEVELDGLRAAEVIDRVAARSRSRGEAAQRARAPRRCARAGPPPRAGCALLSLPALGSRATGGLASALVLERAAVRRPRCRGARAAQRAARGDAQARRAALGRRGEPVTLRLHNPTGARAARHRCATTCPTVREPIADELAGELRRARAPRAPATRSRPPRRGRFALRRPAPAHRGRARARRARSRPCPRRSTLPRLSRTCAAPERYELAARLGAAAQRRRAHACASRAGRRVRAAARVRARATRSATRLEGDRQAQAPGHARARPGAEPDVVIALDAGRMMATRARTRCTKLDHAINAALMVRYVALRSGDKVGLVVFAERRALFCRRGAATRSTAACSRRSPRRGQPDATSTSAGSPSSCACGCRAARCSWSSATCSTRRTRMPLARAGRAAAREAPAALRDHARPGRRRARLGRGQERRARPTARGRGRRCSRSARRSRPSCARPAWAWSRRRPASSRSPR